MRTTFCLAAALLATVFAAGPAPAQSRDRDDRGDRRDREEWGDRDRDRGRDDDDRWRQWLSGMDRNNDGKITEEEAGGRSWGYLRSRAQRYGLRVGDSIQAQDILRARERRQLAEQGLNRHGQAQAAGFEGGDPPQAAGFNGATSTDGETERDSLGGDEVRGRARNYARELLDRFDENRNRRLERGEWQKISGSPENSDANRDGVITYDELASRAEYMFRKRAEEERRGSSGSDDRRRAERRPERRGDDERRSYRFTTAHERLPDNLPSWFRDRDRDLDGQVAMHEYSGSWSDRRAEEFARYDKNGDGVITSDEAAGER